MRKLGLIAAALSSLIGVFGLAPQISPSRKKAARTQRDQDVEPTSRIKCCSSRREALCQWQAAVAAVSTAAGFSKIAPAFAATDDASPMSTIKDLLGRLKSIPTFCIVDPQGAAYMVFKNDQAMALGYAFTTFPGALAVLSDAQRNAKEKGFFDVWKDATITTIPLDIAVRLALKKKPRKSPKEQELDTLLMVIPGAVSSKLFSSWRCFFVWRCLSHSCIFSHRSLHIDISPK